VLFFNFFCLSLSLERERETREEERGGEESKRLLPKKKAPPPKKDLISLISLLITKKKIKENWRSLSLCAFSTFLYLFLLI